jgi:hypothetical protein
MSQAQPPSTVRKRRRNPAASTQRHLSIAEVRNDTVLLKNGGLRAILQVEALNFNLKSEVEQQGIIQGYGAFVNTLTFPIQIVVRSMKTNVDDYLAQLRKIGEKHENQLLKQQVEDYVRFIERTLDVADIMQKRFFVVIPFDRSLRQKTLIEQFLEWISPDDSATKAAQRAREFAPAARQLNERVELVGAGLSNIGLHTHRLNTRELLEVYYQIYNPKTSQEQKIPKNMSDLGFDRMTL